MFVWVRVYVCIQVWVHICRARVPHLAFIWILDVNPGAHVCLAGTLLSHLCSPEFSALTFLHPDH